MGTPEPALKKPKTDGYNIMEVTISNILGFREWLNPIQSILETVNLQFIQNDADKFSGIIILDSNNQNTMIIKASFPCPVKIHPTQNKNIITLHVELSMLFNTLLMDKQHEELTMIQMSGSDDKLHLVYKQADTTSITPHIRSYKLNILVDQNRDELIYRNVVPKYSINDMNASTIKNILKLAQLGDADRISFDVLKHQQHDSYIFFHVSYSGIKCEGMHKLVNPVKDVQDTVTPSASSSSTPSSSPVAVQDMDDADLISLLNIKQVYNLKFLESFIKPIKSTDFISFQFIVPENDDKHDNMMLGINYTVGESNILCIFCPVQVD